MPNNNTKCPCGSLNTYEACCALVHKDLSHADTAEKLMRARYTAFVYGHIDFLYDTFHPSTRKLQNKKSIEHWAKANKWMQLVIIKASTNKVEFEAHYLDEDLNSQIHHEKSNFSVYQSLWYYVDGIEP